MDETYFHGIWRMDWGLGNTNKTAALIASLMIGLWGLSYIKKSGFWVALGLFTVLGVGMIHTFSRGGLIAVVAGLGLVLWKAPSPWPKNRIIGIVVSVWVIFGASIYLQANQRYVQGIVQEDRSITNRFNVWKHAPQMMVDAPNGWGIGNAGNAFNQWYQEIDRTEGYRNLVNSHLTWLTEVGWPWRFLYLVAWGVALLLCWPSKRGEWFSIPLGVWVSFGIAATFSSVAESPWLWICPVVSLLLVLVVRWKNREWPSPLLWAGPILLSFLALAVLTEVGLRRHSNPKISAKNSEVVLVGENSPSIWVVYSGKVMGNFYGKTIRQYEESHPVGLAIVQTVKSLPERVAGTVVVTDTLTPDELTRLKKLISGGTKLILLNPDFPPEELISDPERVSQLTVYFGEFSHSSYRGFWQQRATVTQLDGVGNYLPSWLDLISKS